MRSTRCNAIWALACGSSLAMFSSLAAAKTLCVNPAGSGGCFKTIQGAVNGASANDVIQVAAGTYKEDVTIWKSLSLLGAGQNASVIDATGLAHAMFVDGFDHAGLHNVTISGFTLKNALFEGLLVVSSYDVTITNNQVKDNDSTSGLAFTGAATGCPGQPGDKVYENDETGDCGGAIHLIGTSNSTVSSNIITGNADGVLISDETAESRDNLIFQNVITDNPLECGIVLASHPPIGHVTAPYANHFGVDNNTVSENISSNNGVQIGGAGAGMFTDGMGKGHVTGNVIIGNQLTGNGLGGVDIHSHVGPSFHLPADDMTGNQIIGNTISSNLADFGDTATPGSVGININSGDGGSPILGTVVSNNEISDEDVDIAVNTPAEVDVHDNNLLGFNIGVANVCTFDKATACTGYIDATQNFWGCPTGPGASGCTKTSGGGVSVIPWLVNPVGVGGLP